MTGVGIVTDSGCDLPAGAQHRHGITVVPLTVRIGEREYIDGVDLDATTFWREVAKTATLPETAAPAPGAFVQAFERLIANGTRHIICVVMSSKLSGTFDSATVAAASLRGTNDIDIRVIDSRTVSSGLGILGLAAARGAADGWTIDRIEATIASAREHIVVAAALDTLDHLRKGGRIGSARALVGSMMQVKPIIEISHGEVNLAGKVRTRARAIDALVARVESDRPVEGLTVIHGLAPDHTMLAGRLAPLVSDQVDCHDVGAVVGTHSGPRLLGVAYRRRPAG